LNESVTKPGNEMLSATAEVENGHIEPLERRNPQPLFA
jgi:hypothetical protein